MKRLLCVLLLLALLCGCVSSPEGAARRFERSREKFETAALTLLDGGDPEVPAGVKEMRRCGPDKSCVDFYMGGRGLAPSSTYWGVIYTTEDRPVGFQGVTQKYTPEGDSWVWREENGDNTQRVTKLADHWYAYEASF